MRNVANAITRRRPAGGSKALVGTAAVTRSRASMRGVGDRLAAGMLVADLGRSSWSADS